MFPLVSVPWRMLESLVSGATLLAEAQSVITMRVMGLAGLWPVPPGETRRMFEEKFPAFFEGWLHLQRALWRGASPDALAAAWTRPLTRKARSNRRRLQKRAFHA